MRGSIDLALVTRKGDDITEKSGCFFYNKPVWHKVQWKMTIKKKMEPLINTKIEKPNRSKVWQQTRIIQEIVTYIV